MSEREVIKSIMDFAFIIKAQLHSEESSLLRSILSIAIMESEDLIENIDDKASQDTKKDRRPARG
ncbi:MAG: hypothetical protein FD175_2150 [Beijerinckiaceae bacterium]|nr:MAG: hypothetical protein FD175_2150 [Beijerinckiaceae bacterium]